MGFAGLAAVAMAVGLGSAVGVGLMVVAAAPVGVLPPLALSAPGGEIAGFLRHAGPLSGIGRPAIQPHGRPGDCLPWCLGLAQ